MRERAAQVASGVSMLSIGRMCASAWEYYAREVGSGLDDYYSGTGEAPGVWTGRGALAAKVFGEADAEGLRLAFGEARHPVFREPLGSGWREPDGVAGFDATFSAPKSVSVLFAIGGVDVRAEVVAAHVAAVEQAGLGYLENHAALTRRGHNGAMVVDTEGLVVARFEHRTSRALDPQLHSHCLILNKVRDPRDGSWRALDGRALFGEAKTAGTLYQTGLRAELTRRLGVAWGPVSEHGQAELDGMPEDVLARFSTRTAQIEAAARAKVTELEAALGRALEPDERRRVYRLAVLSTRAPKTHGALPDQTLYGRWATEVAGLGYEPAALVRDVLHPPTRRVASAPVTVLEEVTAERATFARRDVVQAIARHLDMHVGTTAEQVRVQVEALADRVLARPEVVCLHAPERAEPPAVLVRRDGWSVWDAPQQVRYTTREILRVEAGILHAAAMGRVARVGVVEPGLLDRVVAVEPRPLGADQLDAVAQLTSRGRRVETVIGPAGAGKTTMLRVAARAWYGAGHQVLGVAHTAVAAGVLRSEADISAETLAKFLDWHDHGATPASWRLSACHVVIVDEASMVATPQLARLVAIVEAADAKLVLVGDDRQLGAIRAPGGMFAALAQQHGAIELRQTHRFAHAWEAAALTQLRGGHGGWLGAFEAHGRIHGGTEIEASRELFGRWWAAHQAGRDAIMLTPDHRRAGELAARARTTRVVAGQVTPDGLHLRTPTGSQVIGVGDQIETRRNHRRLRYGPGAGDFVRNHDRWTVLGVDETHGTMRVEHARHQAHLTLPADYVNAHVRLAYATTIASAQGLTVDESHVLVMPATYQNELYVALSRGRDANHAYAICEPDPPPDHARHEPGGPASPSKVLAQVAQHERPDWAAHSVLHRTLAHPEQLDVVHARADEVTRLLSHTPPGPDRDALDAYRDRLDELGTAPELHMPDATRDADLALRPTEPHLELDLDLDLGL
jgi:conjugative relaxase-like TrwC/TraI family protein